MIGTQEEGKRPELSVVIVSHECRAALAACLRSLAPECASNDVEVVVVDNASLDGTVSMVLRDFRFAELIANPDNVGFARAVNDGVARARGRHILLLNPDTAVPEGTVRRLLDKLDEHPEVGMLGVKLVRMDGSFDHACKRGLPSVVGALAYLVGLHRLFPRSRRLAQYTAGHLDPDATSYVDAISGAFMLVRGDALASVGELDDRFWLYGEDLDYCLRLGQQGWKVLYWPEITVTHVKGASSGARRPLALNRAFHTSIWHFYEKHHARRHPPLLNAAVFLAIWLRFGLIAIAQARPRLRPRSRGLAQPSGATPP